MNCIAFLGIYQREKLYANLKKYSNEKEFKKHFLSIKKSKIIKI